MIPVSTHETLFARHLDVDDSEDGKAPNQAANLLQPALHRRCVATVVTALHQDLLKEESLCRSDDVAGSLSLELGTRCQCNM